MSVDAKDLAAAYINIRNEREVLKREYEDKDNALKADMDELEQMMLVFCNDLNADSIKTEEGTIMRQIKERFTCNDWDSFYSFVLEQGIPQVLEKRIHQGNFKEFLTQHEGEGLPEGVTVMKEYGITVRKPSSK